jgi:ATP-dependent RNA helicase DOB1
MNDIIKSVIAGDNIDSILREIHDRIFMNGPISITDMEIVSLLSLYQNEKFRQFESSILLYMGVFYKEITGATLQSQVFEQYKSFIEEVHNVRFTPIQAKISQSIASNNCYSFSAPTSTGKSFVFINKILRSKSDVVIVVPSRALINEYFIKISTEIKDTSINVLTFIDKINTRHARRNIFIVTPERCRELFKHKELFNVDLFLFDEAQLGDEDSTRGLYFDSVIRRGQKSFPDAKFVFAQPFIENPESQIIKNHFDFKKSAYSCFKHKNVGQLFMCIDKEWNFYHFGVEKDIMGGQKVKCEFDPINKIMQNNGSVLFYVSKSKIYNGTFMTDYARYIEQCNEIDSSKVDYYIQQIQEFTGGDTNLRNNHYSKMLALLKRGIVIHHGSMPLQTRIILEKFTQEGFCRLCFATSTLEQGINMPFDAVFVDRLEASKPLAVKNLIGRAGRSTKENKFDYGFVILSSVSQMSQFRKIMLKTERLKETSSLESNEMIDSDFDDFKKSILDGTFSDEYNLTESEVQKLSSRKVSDVVRKILDATMIDDHPIPLEAINRDIHNRLAFYSLFNDLYSIFLGRSLEKGEGNVLNTAVKIMLWRVYGRSFKNICWYRYSYVSKAGIRSELLKKGEDDSHVLANFMTGYHDIPDKSLNVFSLFEEGTKASEIDYDLVMYDTYDYIDKLIGFKLSDIFNAAFMKYHEETGDERAFIFSNFIRYGTNNKRHIWMLRYGLSFEEIDFFDNYIEAIDETEILFNKYIHSLSSEEKEPVIRFIH